MRESRLLWAAMGLALVFLGCAGAETRLPGAEQGRTLVKVEPSRIYEDCFKAGPESVMTYAFDASRPLDFNVHYHEGGEAFYPVKDKGVKSTERTYRPEKKQYYCLMWTNTSYLPAHLSYACTVRKAEAPASSR